jgi:hypothetical protein
MKRYCGGANFKILHHNFINGDISGKIFMMKSYETESIHWGKGAIIHLYKAEPFLLNIIFEWRLNDPDGFIGDIEVFNHLVNENVSHETSKKIRNNHHNFKRKTKRMLSLHNILREHKSFRKKKVKRVMA